MKIVIFGPILLKNSQMTLPTNDDFYALQLCFSSFFWLEGPKIHKLQKTRFWDFFGKNVVFCNLWIWKNWSKAKSKIIKIVITQWAKSFHTQGKSGFPSLLGVHIVCEHPPWYYKRKCKEKMWKSLLRKKLNAFFGAAPGFEPATL